MFFLYDCLSHLFSVLHLEFVVVAVAVAFGALVPLVMCLTILLWPLPLTWTSLQRPFQLCLRAFILSTKLFFSPEEHTHHKYGHPKSVILSFISCCISLPRDERCDALAIHSALLEHYITHIHTHIPICIHTFTYTQMPVFIERHKKHKLQMDLMLSYICLSLFSLCYLVIANANNAPLPPHIAYTQRQHNTLIKVD